MRLHERADMRGFGSEGNNFHNPNSLRISWDNGMAIYRYTPGTSRLDKTGFCATQPLLKREQPPEHA
jgi:hypothetical protein